MILTGFGILAITRPPPRKKPSLSQEIAAEKTLAADKAGAVSSSEASETATLAYPVDTYLALLQKQRELRSAREPGPVIFTPDDIDTMQKILEKDLKLSSNAAAEAVDALRQAKTAKKQDHVLHGGDPVLNNTHLTDLFRNVEELSAFALIPVDQDDTEFYKSGYFDHPEARAFFIKALTATGTFSNTEKLPVFEEALQES